MATHKKDSGALKQKRDAALALLKKHGATGGTGHLKGSRRAECKAALNWLHHNPAPKKRTTTTAPKKRKTKEG